MLSTGLDDTALSVQSTAQSVLDQSNVSPNGPKRKVKRVTVKYQVVVLEGFGRRKGPGALEGGCTIWGSNNNCKSINNNNNSNTMTCHTDCHKHSCTLFPNKKTACPSPCMRLCMPYANSNNSMKTRPKDFPPSLSLSLFPCVVYVSALVSRSLFWLGSGWSLVDHVQTFLVCDKSYKGARKQRKKDKQTTRQKERVQKEGELPRFLKSFFSNCLEVSFFLEGFFL